MDRWYLAAGAHTLTQNTFLIDQVTSITVFASEIYLKSTTACISRDWFVLSCFPSQVSSDVTLKQSEIALSDKCAVAAISIDVSVWHKDGSFLLLSFLWTTGDVWVFIHCEDEIHE